MHSYRNAYIDRPGVTGIVSPVRRRSRRARLIALQACPAESIKIRVECPISALQDQTCICSLESKGKDGRLPPRAATPKVLTVREAQAPWVPRYVSAKSTFGRWA